MFNPKKMTAKDYLNEALAIVDDVQKEHSNSSNLEVAFLALLRVVKLQRFSMFYSPKQYNKIKETLKNLIK